MYDFDNAVSEHKSNLIQSMKEFGEEKRIHHLLKGIDLNICDYEFYFYEGQQSRQDEVDKLKSEIDELKWMLKNSNGQADEFCKKCIELQKRIDSALEKCFTGIRKQGGDYYLELVVKILKGNQND